MRGAVMSPLLLVLHAVRTVMTTGVNTASLSLEKCSEGSALIFGTNHIDIDKNNPNVSWDSNGGCRVTFHGSVRCEEEIVLQCTDPDGTIYDVVHNWSTCDVRTTTGPTSTTPNVTLTVPPGGSSRSVYGRISSFIFIIFFVAIIIIISRILNRSRRTKQQSCSNGTVSNPDIEHGGVGITLLNGNGVHNSHITEETVL